MTIELTTLGGPGYVLPPSYEAFRFPAGEAHVKVLNRYTFPATEVARVYGHDPADLFTLAMWANAVDNLGHPRARKVILIPYLPGARADRGFPWGAEVYAGFLNSLEADAVIAVDAHSRVMPGLIENFVEVDSAAIVRHHVVGRPDSDERAQRYDGIIAPDAGAVERAGHVAAVCGLPLYRATKHRDEATGTLSGFSCEPLPDTGRFLVVDDICDGGGTFLGLADATGLPPERLGLYVTHGVFSGSAPANLLGKFGEVWTTDSFPSRRTTGLPSVRTIELAPYLRGVTL